MGEQARQQLQNAYLQTLYSVEAHEKSLTICVTSENLELDDFLAKEGIRTWSIVTADNPFSTQLSASENEIRRADLMERLKGANLTFLKSYGRDPSEKWPAEIGFFVPNISREFAIQLGKEFQQNAIVFGASLGRPELIWCEGEKVQNAGKIIDLKAATLQLVQKMKPDDQEKVHEWATRSLVIVKRTDLTKLQKAKELSKLNPPKNLYPLFQAVFDVIKDKTWTGQSWARRGLVVGLATGTAVFGSSAAGLASAGFGIGVPIALLTTVGTTFLGVLVDEINKERNNKDGGKE